MTDPLSPARFEAIVAAYGAAPHRWPEEEQAGALALLRADPAAARLLDEAGRADALLDRYAVAPPSPALRATVVTRFARARGRWRPWWALALAMAGGGGVLAGTAAAAAAAARDQPTLSIWDRGQPTAFGDLPGGEG